LHAGARTPVAAPRKGRASRRVTGGSSLRRTQRPPSGLRRRCRRLPCSGGFLPGASRASPVPMQPFAACCRPYPAGIGCGCQPAFFRRRCCLHHGSSGSASGPTLTRLAQRSMPAARSVAPRPEGRVRQEAPRRAFATPTRLLSFTAPWPLPCRDFHSLGCTAFLLVTPYRTACDSPRARGFPGTCLAMGSALVLPTRRGSRRFRRTRVSC
jgi:hypothetical protein